MYNPYWYKEISIGGGTACDVIDGRTGKVVYTTNVFSDDHNQTEKHLANMAAEDWIDRQPRDWQEDT
jgi:hypothetical protein